MEASGGQSETLPVLKVTVGLRTRRHTRGNDYVNRYTYEYEKFPTGVGGGK